MYSMYTQKVFTNQYNIIDVHVGYMIYVNTYITNTAGYTEQSTFTDYSN